jgi:hypothetical protein
MVDGIGADACDRHLGRRRRNVFMAETSTGGFSSGALKRDQRISPR